MPPLVISFSGITGEERRRYISAVTALGGVYSGALVLNGPNRTNFLACNASLDSFNSSAKVSKWLEGGQQIISLQWIDDSLGCNGWLDPLPYVIEITQGAFTHTGYSTSEIHRPSWTSPPEVLRGEARAADLHAPLLQLPSPLFSE
jgi:hypothetical protein